MSSRRVSKEEVVEQEHVSNPETIAMTDLKEKEIIDTVHTDEAMKVLANYTGDHEWTDLEEKKLRRKIDWKLLSILCITYGLQYYDKAMLAQAVSPPYPIRFPFECGRF